MEKMKNSEIAILNMEIVRNLSMAIAESSICSGYNCVLARQ